MLVAVTLAGCADRERDELTDRIESGISADQSTDPAERRAVAESLAEDVMTLQADAEQAGLAGADGTDAARADAERAAAIAADCAQMRTEIEALRRLQQGGGERALDPAEAAEIEAETERRTLRIAQNCS